MHLELLASSLFILIVSRFPIPRRLYIEKGMMLMLAPKSAKAWLKSNLLIEQGYLQAASRSCMWAILCRKGLLGDPGMIVPGVSLSTHLFAAPVRVKGKTQSMTASLETPGIFNKPTMLRTLSYDRKHPILVLEKNLPIIRA
ncbi:hypothetical protein Tco_0859874 [Tanacetum coccineum]|uniref:Uncharacterized protein n=1 Tax=Tanacetum coccineum TaxID=301880 RepID=A0ABQ5BGD1_9ASTR